MSGEHDALLDLEVSRARLHALARAGLLDVPALDDGLRATELRPSRKSWGAFLHHHALIVGVLLLVSGVIFFVAANWGALGGMTKLGIVGGGLVLATMGGGVLGDSLAGRAAMLLGALLFGPLLAVYSQIYQTGADPWQLFAWWAVVMTVYALVIRFVGMGVFALLLAHIAIIACVDQQMGWSFYEGSGGSVAAGLIAFDFILVAVAERTLEGLGRRTMIHVAAIFGIVLAMPFGVALVIGEPFDGGGWGVFVLLAGLAGIWWFYRWRRPEVGMLASLAMAVTGLVSSACGHIIFGEMDMEIFGVFLLGVLVCAQVWALTRWLLAWRREHSPPDKDGEAGGSQQAGGVR